MVDVITLCLIILDSDVHIYLLKAAVRGNVQVIKRSSVCNLNLVQRPGVVLQGNVISYSSLACNHFPSACFTSFCSFLIVCRPHTSSIQYVMYGDNAPYVLTVFFLPPFVGTMLRFSAHYSDQWKNVSPLVWLWITSPPCPTTCLCVLVHETNKMSCTVQTLNFPRGCITTLCYSFTVHTFLLLFFCALREITAELELIMLKIHSLHFIVYQSLILLYKG